MRKKKTTSRKNPWVWIVALSIFVVAGVIGVWAISRYKSSSGAAKTSQASDRSQSTTPQIPPDTVAVVAGENISAAEFSANIRIRNLIYIQQYAQMVLYLGDDASVRQQYQSEIDNLAQSIQEYLVVDRLIRQEAALRGITVSREEIDRYMQAQLGYYPGGTPTPTSPPGGESGGNSAAPAVTPTLTVPQSATSTPFTLEAYNALYQQYLSTYAHYQVSETDLIRTVQSQLIRDKVQAAVLADANAVPSQQEFIWARHIQVSSEKTAREVIKKLNQGADFAELAQQYSNDAGTKDQGGDLGWFSRAEADADFANAAFALQNTDDFTQEPVKTSLGYHVIQLLGREERPFASDQDRFNYWLNVQKKTVDIVLASEAVLKTMLPPILPLPNPAVQATATPAP